MEILLLSSVRCRKGDFRPTLHNFFTRACSLSNDQKQQDRLRILAEYLNIPRDYLYLPYLMTLKKIA